MNNFVHNRRVAITPAVLPSNAFVQAFSKATARSGRHISDSRWNFFRLAMANVVMLHWPDCFFDPRRRKESRRKLLKMRLAKRVFGTKFVWIAHNAMPHGARRSDPDSAAFIQELDGIIHLCRAGSDIINESYDVNSGTRQLITVHGRYDNDKPPLPFQPVAAENPVQLLGCGLLKPYKNFELAIDAMRGQSSRAARLRILGKDCDSRYVALLHSMAVGNAAVSVEAVPTLLSDAEVIDAVDACDLFIIPYEKILNSGAALLALSRNRPVLAPDMGGLGELQDMVGRPWVYLYSGVLSEDILRDALEWLRTTPRPQAPDLTAFSWDRVAGDLDRYLTAL